MNKWILLCTAATLVLFTGCASSSIEVNAKGNAYAYETSLKDDVVTPKKFRIVMLAETASDADMVKITARNFQVMYQTGPTGVKGVIEYFALHSGSSIIEPARCDNPTYRKTNVSGRDDKTCYFDKQQLSTFFQTGEPILSEMHIRTNVVPVGTTEVLDCAGAWDGQEACLRRLRAKSQGVLQRVVSTYKESETIKLRTIVKCQTDICEAPKG